MRLSAGSLTVMIVGILALLVGGLALKEYLKEETVVATPPPPPVYAIALGDLQPGRVLTVGDIGRISEPNLIFALERQAEAQSNGTEGIVSPYLRERFDAEGNAIPGEYRLNLPMDTMTNPQDLIGRRIKENVPNGTPFSASMLYPEGYRPALTTEVKDGRGIYTVGITNFLPGDQDVSNLRADVLFRNRAITELPGYDPIPEQTVVLVRDARILEAGDPYVPASSGVSGDSGASSSARDRVLTDVTLAVSLDDGAKLLTAQDNGELTLVLYNGDSDAGTEISTIDDAVASVKLTDFLQATPTPAPEIEIQPYDTIIFRGTDGFTNNSFAFDDLLRELAEVGAIEIKMDPQVNDVAANPADFTVPLNQPSNSGQRGAGGSGGSAATAGADTGSNAGSGAALDTGGGGGPVGNAGGGGG